MFVVEKAKQKHNKINCKKTSSLFAPVKVAEHSIGSL